MSTLPYYFITLFAFSHSDVFCCSRAHYLVLDLLYDFAALVSRVGIQGLGPVRGATMSEMLMGVTQGPPPGFSDGRSKVYV